MFDPCDPRGNSLLAALSEVEWQRCMLQVEPVELRAGQPLCNSGVPVSHVYFPTSAVVSLLYMAKDGAPLEIAQVGYEGMVGVSMFLGGRSTTTSAEVARAGQCFRMRASLLQQEFDRGGAAMHLLLSYTQALIAQIAQNAVCNRLHTLEQQLARWLLISLDRLHASELLMTQESIASRLGVRREGVTEAALKLQAAGLIRYSRGHIHVLDRHGLEQRSCECYRVIRAEYDRLVPAEAPGRRLQTAPRATAETATR
jgi:CRP-like cAMP-binding protein